MKTLLSAVVAIALTAAITTSAIAEDTHHTN
jgi:hypothetical protein